MMDNLHYRITVRLEHPTDKDAWHDVEILIPRDNICEHVVGNVLLPELTTTSIEICNSYVLKRIDD